LLIDKKGRKSKANTEGEKVWKKNNTEKERKKRIHRYHIVKKERRGENKLRRFHHYCIYCNRKKKSRIKEGDRKE